MFPALKTNDRVYDIFKFFEFLKAVLILRVLSRRGMQVSFIFHQQADIQRRKVIFDPPSSYPGINLFKIPVEVKIGCVKDVEKFLALKKILVLKDITISPNCRCIETFTEGIEREEEDFEEESKGAE